MTTSNSLRLSYVEEVTLGETPGSPAMKKLRVTGESIAFAPTKIRSEEIREDRLTPDHVTVAEVANGGITAELSYGAFDDMIASAMWSDWVSLAELENVTGDDIITQVTNATDTFTVTAGGAAFVAGSLVRTSGFTNAANNGTFVVGSSTATTVVMAGTPVLVDEAAPPAGARIKRAGGRATAGDITATAGGVGSTTTNFVTLGLTVGQWIKLSGFTVAVLNAWARVAAVSATALTLDHKPAGWVTDAGTAQTISIWFGDYITIGTTRKSFSIEKVFLRQAVPEYHVYQGMVVNQMTVETQAGQIVGINFDFLGMTMVAPTTTPLDASPDEADQNTVYNSVHNAVVIAEGGTPIALTSPNRVQRTTLTLNNNLRAQSAEGALPAFNIADGDADVTQQFATYYGSAGFYGKLKTGQESSWARVFATNGKAMVFDMPRTAYQSGTNPATGRNQDVINDLTMQALRQAAAPNRQLTIHRIEYE